MLASRSQSQPFLDKRARPRIVECTLKQWNQTRELTSEEW